MRTIAVVSICFCIKKPTSFYWASQTVMTALDAVLFTGLVIWSAVNLFRPEVIECRTNDLYNTSTFWFFVAFCCIVGALYSLFLVLGCCVAMFLLCFVCCFVLQNRRLAMSEAINRVPLAQAAMRRIGHHQYKDSNQKSKEQDTCIICLAQFKEDDQVSELNCDDRHIFHTTCL